MSNETVREELVKFLSEKGVKQKKIADVVGCSPQTINMFLLNKRNISYKKLIVIHSYISSQFKN